MQSGRRNAGAWKSSFSEEEEADKTNRISAECLPRCLCLTGLPHSRPLMNRTTNISVTVAQHGTDCRGVTNHAAAS